MTVDELQVLITANTNELRKEINNANKTISGLKKSAEKGTAGVQTAFSKLKTGIVALGIGKIIKDSITSGMDAIESDSLFSTVMGENTEAVRSWSSEVSNALGLSAVNMQKNIGVIYNMTSSMGVAGDNALKMSKGISVLSEDMASFYNLDSTEAFNKLRAGLTGETEPLKSLGILVDENTVKQVAYSEGIAENGAELTQQQKVLARYVAILRQTGNAQGDLARTLTSPSNQLRSLKQNVQNLGIAFSNFLMPVVQAVLPWLNALARVATQALNSLASFMGFTGDGGASDETKKINDNVSSFGSGLDGANKKAKKLKQSLAGFDEMNVLQDNSSDSADTGGGSAGGATASVGFDLSEYNAHLDWISGETDALVEKIKSAFSGIGDGISFDKLITAFNNLKKAVQPLTSKIWDGLKWAYDKILKPLAKWTIEDLVPAFLDAVSGSLEILNPILEGFQTVGTWFWDNFLSPIAEWAGETIVTTLEGLGTVLSDIGTWMSENQGIVDAMVASITAFFLAWEITKLLGFIEMSGGLIAVFTNLTTAIWACTGAKIADKLETMYLIALYAGDFIKKIAMGTAEIVKQIAQWALLTGAKALDAIKTGVVTVAQGAWNAICAVGTAVTTALGTAFAFLTSPIGLVVLAIGAVIAIVVLCIKYWDEIKAVATKCWDGIKNAWSVASGWINDKVVMPIKNFFTGLWDGLKEGAKSVWEGIKNVFSKVGEFFGGMWDKIKETFSTIGTKVGDAVSGALKTAVNWVLEKAIGIINGFISAINFAIDLINEIPGVSISRLDKLEVPKLARGGVVDRATLAVVGEAGKEAVMPLERNTGWIDQLASKLGDKIGGGAGNIQLVVKLGEEAIFDKFIEYGREKSFETNGEVVFV